MANNIDALELMREVALLKEALLKLEEKLKNPCARCGSTDRRLDIDFHCSTCYRELKNENRRLRERLQYDPGGSDKIDELEQALEFSKHELMIAKAKSDVRGGDWCAKNRAEGRGPCGACAWCCNQIKERAERFESLLIEWRHTPFFEDEDEWRAWRNKFATKINEARNYQQPRALINNAAIKKLELYGGEGPPQPNKDKKL